MAEGRKRISPYLEWAVLTEFAYLPGEWFWVLLELDGPAEALARSVVRSGLDQFIRIPAVYQEAPPSLRGADLTCCMAIARREALSAFVSGKVSRGDAKQFAPLLSSINRIELGTPTTNLFEKTEPIEQQLLATSPSRRAIVAIIDDGLAFAHERFRFQGWPIAGEVFLEPGRSHKYRPAGRIRLGARAAGERDQSASGVLHAYWIAG
jgi:hypothetical protein